MLARKRSSQGGRQTGGIPKETTSNHKSLPAQPATLTNMIPHVVRLRSIYRYPPSRVLARAEAAHGANTGALSYRYRMGKCGQTRTWRGAHKKRCVSWGSRPEGTAGVAPCVSVDILTYVSERDRRATDHRR
eukprot:scaffold784_cov399-Prasinococcus_capsulatus_cf.AAC.8